MFYDRIVSIDFETASGSRASVCSIGFVVVENGLTIDEGEILVNPKTEFGRFQQAIHKISPLDVVDAPTWDVAWPLVERFITESTLVIGHNLRSMELACIRQECDRYNMPIPSFAYIDSGTICDTLPFAKEVISARSYSLDTLCYIFDIELNHHNALSDAKGCLHLFYKLNEFANLNSNLVSDSNELNRPYSTDDFCVSTNVFDGKNIVFTGKTPHYFKRDELRDLARRFGADTSSNNITKKTQLLVVGSSPGRKLQLATQRGIEIISMEDFLVQIKKATEFNQ